MTNWIFQHNGNLELETNYDIRQGQQEVTIVLGVQGETFEFEARWGEWIAPEVWDDHGPGDINLIIANENAGPVVLTILPHIGSTYGARHVKEIDLSAAGVDSTIDALTISEDLGALGPIIADRLGGALTVERDILDDITLAMLAGDITCDSLADLTVTGGTSGPPGTGSLVIYHKALMAPPLSRAITSLTRQSPQGGTM